MTAWLAGLWRGERSMPGRYPVIFYVALMLTPDSSPLRWVFAGLLGPSLALFFVRPPAWFFRVGDRLFGADPVPDPTPPPLRVEVLPERVVIEARYKEIDR